jgi:hypothetical protein
MMRILSILTLMLGPMGHVVWAQKFVIQDLAKTEHILIVEGHVMNGDDKQLDSAIVTVSEESKPKVQWSGDGKGRFEVALDIGGLYAIDVERRGYVKKRFIIDARTDEPSKVITGPFEAMVTLIAMSAVEGVDLEELDFPFALVTYSKKDKAFMADPAYIEEMKRLESSLMLGSARAKRQKR